MGETMWALVKEKPEVGLWMKRVPVPEVGPNDVKIGERRLKFYGRNNVGIGKREARGRIMDETCAGTRGRA